MIEVSMTDATAIAKAVRDLGDSKELERSLWTVAHNTAYWGRAQALKGVGKVVNTAQKNLKPAFYYKKQKPHTVTLHIKGWQVGMGIPLKYFRPRQLKKKQGVTVNSYDKGGGRITNPKWFMFDRGKNVYERFGKGYRDYKMVRYPQTVDTYRRLGLQAVQVKALEERLVKETKRRVRYLILKFKGQLRGVQPKRVT